MKRRGFASAKQASREEELVRQQFGRTALAADGTVAAELTHWLEERELDVAPTTLANYRNAVMTYIVPGWGLSSSTILTNGRSTTSTDIC